MNRLKILLLGKNGQLGWEAERQLFCLGRVFSYDYPDINFLKPNTILKLIDEIKPDLIYNAVAYTAVDKAEEETEIASIINAEMPGLIAEKCNKLDIPLVHFSTDYVFDGSKGSDYTEEDRPQPLNVYGKTKLDGENNIIDSGSAYLIFRTSWVYSNRAGGFLKKVMGWAQNNEELRIVDDQIGNPTWARTLAILSTKIIPSSIEEIKSFFEQHNGLYHLAGGGNASRLEWTRAIIENLADDFPCKVKRINSAKTSDFPALAIRPLYSALNCDFFQDHFKLRIPDWQETLPLAING
jgi:dTDP-4-dehydrorhamnose reductase